MLITKMSSIRQCEKHTLQKKAVLPDLKFCFRILDQSACLYKKFHSLVSGRG